MEKKLYINPETQITSINVQKPLAMSAGSGENPTDAMAKPRIVDFSEDNSWANEGGLTE